MSNPFPFPSNEAILAGSKQHAEADFALSVQLAECRAEIERLRLAAPQPEPTKGDPLGLCALPCGHDGPHDTEAAPQPEPSAGLREALDEMARLEPVLAAALGDIDHPALAELRALITRAATATPSSPLDVERLARAIYATNGSAVFHGPFLDQAPLSTRVDTRKWATEMAAAYRAAEEGAT